MVAMLELQISADTFTASILSTLRSTPRCLPAITAGFQLQRVRYRAVSLRHDTQSSFRIWRDPHWSDVGQPWDWITALQTRIAVDVTVDVATDADIAAHPNGVVPPTVSLNATVIFDFDCEPGPWIGWLELKATFVDVEIPAAAMLPGGLPAKPWLVDQLRALLTIPPQQLDFRSSLPPGKWFQNAGVTVDRSGTRLAIRAQQLGGGETRWLNFLNGFVEDLLGANQWSIAIGSADLVLTLHRRVEDELKASLKSDYVESLGASVDYFAQPGRAIFIVTLYVRFLDLHTEDIPIRLEMSVDPVTGHLVIDVDAYGVRDLVDSVMGIVGVIINLLLPIAGWLLTAALHDFVGTAMHFVSMDIANDPIAGAPEGTTLQELPGQPFRYRASVPIATPPIATGRVTELITSDYSVALAGTWNVPAIVEGPLAVEISNFYWRVPTVGCGSAAEEMYKDIAEHPMKYAYAYGEIALDTPESAPIQLCDVSVLSALAPQARVNISWTNSQLPTTIEITASAEAAVALPDPLVLAVRTSAGVFRAELAAPGPIDDAVAWLRALVGVQLEYCDSIHLPAWFGGEGKFDPSWIVDPLVDPDRLNTLVDVVTFEVEGLVPGAALVLADTQERELASVLARAGAPTRIQLARNPAAPAPSASVRLRRDTQARTTAAQGDRGFQVKRERLQITGGLRVSERVHEVIPAPALGAGQFLLRQSDGCLQLDTRRTGCPTIVAQWMVPGLRAVSATPAGILAFGGGGSFQLDTDGRSCAERFDREPMMFASGAGRYIAAAGRDRVDVLNFAGGLIARIALSAQPTGVLIVAGQLLVSTDAETCVYAITDHAIETRQRIDDLQGLRLIQSQLDGTVYGVRADGGVVVLTANERGWARGGEYSDEPWTTGAATMGRMLVHRGDGFAVTVLRRPPRATLVSVLSADHPPAKASADHMGRRPVLG